MVEQKRKRCKTGSRWNKAADRCQTYVFKSSPGSTRKKTPEIKRTIPTEQIINLKNLPTRDDLADVITAGLTEINNAAKKRDQAMADKISQLPTSKEFAHGLNILNQSFRQALSRQSSQVTVPRIISPEVRSVYAPASSKIEMENPMRKASAQRTKKASAPKQLANKYFSRVNRDRLLGKKPGK